MRHAYSIFANTESSLTYFKVSDDTFRNIVIPFVSQLEGASVRSHVIMLTAEEATMLSLLIPHEVRLRRYGI